ncbi:MAG: adenylate/guanylate cyclase domain-containing protein [Nitrospirae bacterium]|nr:adenylate/guanylate cyclase domain-containing protein [Nitrospirota bacterium]
MRKFSWMSSIKLVGFVISVVVAFIFIALYAKGPAIMEILEGKSLDMRFRLRGGRPPAQPVTIVTIDEKSLAELGRWPWSRARMAELVDALKSGGAKVVAFDVMFPHAEVGLTEEQAAFLGQASADDPELVDFVTGSISGDHQFKDSLSSFGTGVLALALSVPVTGKSAAVIGEHSACIEKSAFMLMRGDEDASVYLTATSSEPPIEELCDVSSAGHIYAYLDRDGTIRWQALAIKYKDRYYPSLGLETARLYLDIPREAMRLDFMDGVALGDISIPTDEHGLMLIDYCGKDRTFPYYSFSDVLAGKTPPGAFKDKIVLVGASALGIYDLRVTPFAANMPGVETHANVIDNILNRHFLSRRETSKLVTLLTILGVCLLLGIVMPRLGPLSGAVVTLAVLLTGWAVNYYAFAYQGMWLDLTYSTFSVVFVYTGITTYRFLAEENKARSIKKIFSSYVTPKMVDQLAKNPDLAKLGGERKEMTVMFSDVRGFTTFSESRQPEEVVARLNEYMTAMTDVIFKWDGTVDKFVGDEIMAFWGAPLPQEDHVERAVLCAVDMVTRLKDMQAKWAAEGKAILDMGIGINTGEMVVGNMGAEGKKMDYTVIGDNVNLGARVETLTRNYESHVIISEFTYAKLMERAKVRNNLLDKIIIKELDSVKVKGKERPVTIYRVSGKNWEQE